MTQWATIGKTVVRCTGALAGLLLLTAEAVYVSGIGAGLLWALLATDAPNTQPQEPTQ